ncbi:hypothetical protein ABH944_004850 [Caballeronia udeis]|uniref:Uncharacterized protein n=1 Tax=Caballeronia udeis TaxID=1232866 RepID=A0ABW8MPD4_9BURK
MNHNTAGFSYKQFSASANMCVGDGIMAGIFVSSTTAGTVTVYDDAATGTTTKIVDTVTLAVGWNPMPFAFSKGLNIVVGGTLSATLGYIPG